MLPSETKRVISYSFRIDNETHPLLEEEARQKQVSVNVLLNQIAREHFIRKKFEKIGCVQITKDILREVFDLADESQLIKRAEKLGSAHAAEYIQFLYRDVNKSNAIKFLDLLFGRFQGFQHEIHGSTHSFSILHDLNEKYSIFVKAFVKSFCETMFNEPAKIQTTARTIMFSFSI